jgi:hypothetical protein
VRGELAQRLSGIRPELAFEKHQQRPAEVRHPHDEFDRGGRTLRFGTFIDLATQAVEQEVRWAVRAGSAQAVISSIASRVRSDAVVDNTDPPTKRGLGLGRARSS